MKGFPDCLESLKKLCHRRGYSKEDAEDLVYDAVLHFLEYPDRAKVRSDGAFLAQIVINRANNEYNRKRFVTSATKRLEASAQAAVLDSNPDPERVLCAQQRLESTAEALGRDRPRAAAIFIGQRAGYSHQELAETHGIKKTTVQKDIARAKKRLATLDKAALLSLLVLLGVISRDTIVDHPSQSGATYQTDLRKRDVVTLNDGSELHLNTDTSLTISDSPRSRNLLLKNGELYADVRHDDFRTFRVKVGHALFAMGGWGIRSSVRQQAKNARL
jgi:RNA polymerase sigma factor (sigma-70 family)